MQSFSWLFIVGFLAFYLPLSSQTPFEFANKVIQPGTKEHLTIKLSDGTTETCIPITVFHGKTDGPILGITAGVHGYEYAPILAGQRLIHQIDPIALTGTVILVQITNVESFLGRSPYLNPADKKNLNRSFPGDPTGTITDRLADFISKKVIGRSDFFVDMHSGDAPEDLMAYVAYYQHDDLEKVSEQGRQMAAKMGFDHIVVFKTTGKDYMEPNLPSLYCSAEAFKQGIPAVDVECGRLGIVEEEYIDQIVHGVEALLKHLDMLDGEPMPFGQPTFIEERTSISSNHVGFFYPLKSSGSFVVKGMKIGYITDFFNRTLEDVYAPKSGVILYMLGTPPVNKGETLVNLGVIKE